MPDKQRLDMDGPGVPSVTEKLATAAGPARIPCVAQNETERVETCVCSEIEFL
jgi:hypothetical protein